MIEFGRHDSAVGQHRMVRVFVSSTFRDMHAERDYLNRFVFPELRSRCRALGGEFIGVDLRWGVTSEEAELRGALSICREEIDRCHPYFLALIGDRYGWIPPPEVIDNELFSRTLEDPALTAADRLLLTTHYNLDETCEPSVQRLDPSASMSEQETANIVRIWESVGLSGAGKSITAHEIGHALEAEKFANAHRFIYIRQFQQIEDPDFPASFLPVFVENDQHKRQQLIAIKNSLRAQAIRKGGILVRDYAVRYEGLRVSPSLLSNTLSDEDREHYSDGVFQPEDLPHLSPEVRSVLDEHGTLAVSGLEAWGERVIEDLWLAIQAEWGDPTVSVNQAGARDYHDRFIRHRTDLFVGRKDLLERMLILLGDEGSGPVVVTGPPGGGKSALMAEFARRCREAYPGLLVLPYFIGVEPGSTSLSNMIYSLCAELRQQCSITDEVSGDPDKLHTQLRDFMTKAAARQPVILLLDAINQLEAVEGAHDLRWLPFETPDNAAVIVSTLAGTCLDHLRERVADDRVIQVTGLGEGERKELIRQHLALRGKKLNEPQIERLIDTSRRPEADLPLYVLVALEELCLFGQYDAIEKHLDWMAPTISGLFDQVLARLEVDHTVPVAETILTRIAASRSGLVEAEILDLLGKALQDASPLIWLKFYRALEFYLLPRDETSDATAPIDFYHEQLRLAVYRRYFGMESLDASPSMVFRDVHRQLAEYFHAAARDSAASPEWRPERTRALSELPYHQAHAELPQLQQTLSDFHFMDAKLRGVGVQPLIEDYNLLPEETRSRPLRDVQRALRLAARHLRKYPGRLAGQLLGRLSCETGTIIPPMLEEARNWRAEPWLCPCSASLSPPKSEPLLRVMSISYFTPYDVVTTADGRYVVAAGIPPGSSSHAVRVWDLETGSELEAEAPFPLKMRAVAVTPDGNSILAGGDRNELYLFELLSRRETMKLEGHTGEIHGVAIDPTGRYAFSASKDRSIRVWDLTTGTSLAVLTGHNGGVNAVACNSHAHWLISASEDGTLGLWDWRKGQQLARMTGHSAAVNDVAVLPDGRSCISVSHDQTLKIWDLASQREVRTLHGHTEPVRSVVVLPDGVHAASGGGSPADSTDNNVRVWDLASENQVRVFSGHARWITSVAAVPDGHRVLSASIDGSVRLWDMASQQPTASTVGTTSVWTHDKQVAAVAVDRQGMRAVSASYDRTLGVWDVETGVLTQHLHGHTNELSAVSMMPDGERTVSVDRDGTMILWDLLRGVEIKSINVGNDAVNALAVTPDSRYILTASSAGSVAIWNSDLQFVDVLSEHTSPVEAMAVMPDGLLVTGTWDSRVRVWDLESRIPIQTIDPQPYLTYRTLASGRRIPVTEGTTQLSTLALTSDARYVLTAWHGESAIDVWKLENGERIGRFNDSANVYVLASYPLPGQFLSATSEGTLTIWDVEQGQPLTGFDVDHAISSCTASPTGNAIVVGDSAGGVHILHPV